MVRKYKYKKVVTDTIKRALKEDIGRGDVTTGLSIPALMNTKALIIAKEDGVLCGVDIAKEVFRRVDRKLKIKASEKDGALFKKGEKIMRINGRAQSILTAERVALNFLSLLSGTATYTHKFVERVKGTKAKIMDTRKTTPSIRILEKYAVQTGGGKNHRHGLWDGLLIKDNHLKALGIVTKKQLDETKLDALIKRLKKKANIAIEIEVETTAEFKKVIEYKPDIIMLDNFNLAALKKAVNFRDRHYPRVKLESSGGIDLNNVAQIAKSGVDFISIGAITHSPESVDFSLDIVNE
ncbi:MAG: carboxylating nicotinate-nucleotide diphosphorylase [Candidatus Omnitrophota bacterium]